MSSRSWQADAVIPDNRAAAELWWPVLQQARWFQGKGRGGHLVGIRPLAWLVPPQAVVRVRPEIATVRYPDGGQESYQLLVGYRDRDGDEVAAEIGQIGNQRVCDAPRDPEAMAALTSALLGAYTLEHADERITVKVRKPLPERPLIPRWFGGQQSNTNVVLGDVAMLKIFRRLEIGVNLNIEVLDQLRSAGVQSVPDLYGWVEAEVSGEHLDLIAMTELLPDPHDGWQLACDACAQGLDFAADAAALGQALAEVHDGLVDTATSRSGDQLADALEAHLAQALTVAPVLAEHADGLRTVFAGLRGRMIEVQRIHGDFHLGQTLRTAQGWRIIDFEGEPLRPMSERRLPDSCWRDVAGMLRSFGYAASAAGTGNESWAAVARKAFLTAYRDRRAMAADPTVLAAYEADKAVYEVVYETRNRPDWVPIPLETIAQLSTAQAVEERKN